MTKEEFINEIMEFRKQNFSNVSAEYCQRHQCNECYISIRNRENYMTMNCTDYTVTTLIDCIIELEEAQKAETNLEHYAHCFHKDDINEGVVRGELYLDGEACETALKSYGLKEFVNWLLSPYEELKYKLTKFEYDLLNVQSTLWYSLNSLGFLERLIAKGYFKDIPTSVSIKDILDNCEVVKND